MNTIFLDAVEWDLRLDSAGNIAMASEPYSLAQDAASAIRTFLGEVYFDTTLGVPWLTEILGHNPSLALLKARMVEAALTVPGISGAQCFLTAISHRRLTGQVQVTSAATGQVTAAAFEVINPQGVG